MKGSFRGWIKGVKTLFDITTMIPAPDSQCSEIRSKWNSVQRFFHQVFTSDETDLQRLAEQLPEIEFHMDAIIFLLKSERNEFAAATAKHGVQGDEALTPSYEFLLGSETSSKGTAPLDMEGHFLITKVCQFAKHNLPHGARPIMLGFLTQLLRDCDIPGEPPRSMLQYGDVVGPVVDMIVKISAELQTAATKGDHSVSLDDFALVLFMEQICAKIEALPPIATFFVVGAPQVPDSSTSKLFLIDVLLPYLKDCPGGSLTPARKEQMSLAVLNGMLSLAKTPDSIVQNAVASTADVANVVASELCRFMLTLCSIPSESDFTIHTVQTIEMLKFLDSLLLLAPNEANKLEVGNLLREKFLRGTMGKLLTSVHDRSYYASAILFRTSLQSIVSEPTRQIFADFLFDPQCSDAHCDRSLLDAVILPRLHDLNPTVALATATLIAAAIEVLPSSIMKHVFHLRYASAPPAPPPAPEAEAAAEADPEQQQQSPPRDNPPDDGDAAATAPEVLENISPIQVCRDVKQLFAPELNTDRTVCGTPETTFVQEVMQRMLRVEANLWDSNFCEYQLDFTSTTRTSRTYQPQLYAMAAAGTLPLPRLRCSRADIQKSALVTTLCEKLQNALELPVAMNVTVTRALLTLCLYPHPWIPLCLLETTCGPLATALRSLARRIHDMFSVQERGGPSTVFTRLALYRRCASRPFFDPEDEVIGEDSFTSAMAASRTFVEACVTIEGFRQELGAAMAIYELAWTYSQLQLAPPEFATSNPASPEQSLKEVPSNLSSL